MGGLSYNKIEKLEGGGMKMKPFIAKWEEKIPLFQDYLITISTKTVNDHDPDELGFIGTVLTEVEGESDPDELC